MAASIRADDVLFRRDVMAVMSKAGCNLGGCHGNGQGKGGLKLSLRGQDPDLDWLALTRDQGGRRVNVVEPEQSLLLLKATAAVAHDGGQRFATGSPEHTVMLGWLRDGAPDSGGDAPRLTKLEVTPRDGVLVEPKTQIALKATAVFADGVRRDVTRLAVFEPSNLIVKISADGVVTREQAGESTVLVRYLDKQVPVRLAFVPERKDFVWSNPPTANLIDEQVFKKLRTLRVNPSALCDDTTFVRRAYLDLLGLVPSAEAAHAFAADPAPDKRARLVESLLARGEFADFWALKWADLLKIEERQLDTKGMEVFHGWIRQSIAENMPLDRFARELVAARGSTYQNPPANWWRANRDPVTRAEQTARVFLGTQLNCAQCHNHPFERWTQDDYYDWTGLFARLDYKIVENKKKDKSDTREFKGDQIVLLKARASVLNPRTGEAAIPRFLGGEKPQVTKDHDELLALADWLAHSPMFARMQVNRIWFHLLGRGLVDPVDDFRASNPPSHPELLEALARDFAKNGYDLRQIIRTIMTSRVYQLSSEPNATNADDEINHSRGLVRRLTAEQLLDSTSEVLAAPLQIEGWPKATRLSQVPEGRKHYHPLKTDLDRFALAFGKPPRLIATECERTNEPTVVQAFQLISGPAINDLLTRSDNRLREWAASTAPERETVEEAFWTALSRAPTGEECDRFTQHLTASPDKRRGLEDLAWALLNSKEFVFRR
jgi:mono/diheme cytochrome c family protein